MVDLARWLGQQLDEDERAARAARDAEFCKDGRWVVKGPFEEGLGSIHSDAGEAVLGEEESVPFAIADHITRHDPARVLREIDAKRKLLAHVVEQIENAEVWWLEGVLTPVLKHLAAPYSGRPGFREEWAL